MDRGRISRRQMLGLLAAGFLTACSSSRREHGAALPSTTSSSAPAAASPLPFTKTLPGVRFLFLDANHPDDAQAKWLGDQLAAPAPPLFTVAVFHQPVFSCGLHGRTPEVITHWYGALDSGGVSLVLNGHDHEYQRFLTAEGTTFIVTGGGGRELYPMIPGCSAPEMRVGAVKHHFTGIEVYSDRMAVTAVATDGSVIDHVDIPAPLPAP